jgi:hypothetical protein
MGSKVTSEYWCDTCGKTYDNCHDFYHEHSKYTSGNNLFVLERNILKAKNEEKAFEELCDWFGCHPKANGDNIHHAFFDESVIKCIIKGMREGMIHNEDAKCECECSAWYKSNKEVADFIEKNIPKLKDAYNNFIERVVEQKRKELGYLENRINYLLNKKTT